MRGDWENSRDANLSSGDPKSEDSISCTTAPPPPNYQQTPTFHSPPAHTLPHKSSQLPNYDSQGNCLGHFMESYMKHIHHDILLAQWLDSGNLICFYCMLIFHSYIILNVKIEKSNLHTHSVLCTFFCPHLSCHVMWMRMLPVLMHHLPRRLWECTVNRTGDVLWAWHL